MTFVRLVIVVSVLLLLLTGAVLFLFSSGVDSELAQAIQEVEAAVIQGDSEKVLFYISPHFESEGKTYQQVAERIRRNLTPDQYESIEVRDQQVEMVGELGRVTCRIRLIRPRTLPLPFLEYRILAEWRQTEQGWQIVSGEAREVSARK